MEYPAGSGLTTGAFPQVSAPIFGALTWSTEHPRRCESVDAEVEQIHQITDSRAVSRDVRIARRRYRVMHVVAAAAADCRQAPVLFDELQDRDVVCVGVRDVAGLGVLRYHDQRDAGTVAEEVERLHITRVVVAAAFINGDEDSGAVPQRRVLLQDSDDL